MHFNNQLINRISVDIQALQQKIATLPDFQLMCQKNGNYTKFYYKDATGQRSICPPELVNQLVLKQYYQHQLIDLMLEQKYLSNYFSNQHKNEVRFDTFLSRPHVRDILLSALHGPAAKSFIQATAQNLQTINPTDTSQSSSPATNLANTLHPDSLKYKSISGNILRSKSELLIDQFLFQNNYLYQYELPLTLNNITLHPDFTILRNSDQKLIIWEHFGMMDNNSYAQSATKKINTYIENGYIPNINLIATYETLECPLDTRQLELALKILQS